MSYTKENIRNVAIIAHVDHGKTTLVDNMLKQSGVFRENQVVQDRVLDSNELERERGITILAKNTAVFYKGTKINIVDTPGHADFGGEVERVMKMVDGVLLLVDAFEGPMPQTKFVLKKALELNHKVIVVINKVDRPDARPDEVVDEVLDLFIELEASEDQLESPFIFASGKDGTASYDSKTSGNDLIPLFDTIIKYIPAPEGDPSSPLQVLVSMIDYNDYVGRIAIGKVERGTIKEGMDAAVVNSNDESKKVNVKISNLYQFEGLKRVPVKDAELGDIIAITGIPEIHIGDTICDAQNPEALPFVNISEPTIAMTFSVNDSPFAGREGKYVTSRHLRDRLFKEVMTDVSLKVEETDSPDKFKVLGRGELHLSILIETMRREGYEFQVSNPIVLFKTVNGKKQEPMEMVTIDVPEGLMGSVMEKMGTRKGEMVNMANAKGGSVRLEFRIPARGLFGYRAEFITDTKGEGILNSVFDGYAPYKGEIPTRKTGSLIAYEEGDAITYGLFNAQGRGQLFIVPGTKVYGGMVVGENAKTTDIEVNVCKKKHVSNMRTSAADDALRLVPAKVLTLEQAIEFIGEDELVEVTPQSIRIRKKILDPTKRMRASVRASREG